MTKREYENSSIKGGGVTGDSLLPVVVFNFSKKKCDEAADFLSSQDFITGAEKAEVINIMFINLYWTACCLERYIGLGLGIASQRGVS